jgi:hypothetical protein
MSDRRYNSQKTIVDFIGSTVDVFENWEKFELIGFLAIWMAVLLAETDGEDVGPDDLPISEAPSNRVKALLDEMNSGAYDWLDYEFAWMIEAIARNMVFTEEES